MKDLVRVASVILIGLLLLGAVGCEGKTGPAGPPGSGSGTPPVLPGTISGLKGEIAVSTPAGGGGTYFGAGERITFTVTVTDDDGNPIDINSTNLDSPRMYIYGPLDQSKCVTAQNLMNVGGAREYIHLDQTHTGLSVTGNVATFTTGAIAAEAAGTYRVVARLRSMTDAYARDFVGKEFQVKTATVETETVALSKCSGCHQGADNGHHYFHHSDSSSGLGSFEYDDKWESCKACHNQDGYAGTTDSWVPARTRIADPIIRRVHGVHMGEELKSPRNTHRMALENVVGTFGPTDSNDPTSTLAYKIKGQTSGAEAKVVSTNGSTYLALGHVTGEFEIGETVDIKKLPLSSGVPDLTKTAWSQLVAFAPPASAKVKASTSYGSSSNTSVSVAEGYFADYTTVVFPPDVRTCTGCHTDDAWKTKPSQYACGACHDNVWWGDFAALPEGFRKHAIGGGGGGIEIGDIKNGVAGAEHNVSLCNGCHSESTWPIGSAHDIPTFVDIDQKTPATQKYTVELSLEPAPPADGYASGTAPKVYIKVWDVVGASYVNPTTITEASWSGLSLLAGGPRGKLSGVPALTTSAKGQQITVTSGTAQNWNLSGDPVFTLEVNGVTYNLTAAAANFITPSAATAAEVVAWLNGSAVGAPAFNTVVKAKVGTGSSAGKVQIRNKPGTAGSMIDIKPCAVTTAMSWTTGKNNLGSTCSNDLRQRTDAWDADPKVSWNGADMRIEYQLDDVAALEKGTYTLYVNGYKTVRPEGFGLLTFQVKTATAGKHIATNCADCHFDHLMHRDAGGRHPVAFDTDYCNNCHDYRREGQNSDVWAAYGADPIVKKVHGIHYGHYLSYPDKIYPNNPIWSGMIFPQDVRNCTKCHSSDTTGTWNSEPSRLACGSCHDSDAAELHMMLQTYDPTPTYDSVTQTGGAWSGDEVESCKTCHGEGKSFEAKTVHKISDPYMPPYPR